jgi:hypothetical protein
MIPFSPSNQADSPEQGSPPVSLWRTVLRRDGWAMLLAAGMTVVVVMGFYGASRGLGCPMRQSVLATLAAAVLWTVLAVPCLAAGGRKAFSALLRGGSAIDATGLCLLALWLLAGRNGGMSFASAVKVYCVCASVGLAAISAVCLGRTEAGRAAMAVAAAAFLAVAMTSPLWASAYLGEGNPSRDTILAAWAVRINPFFAVCDASVHSLRFVWSEWGRMYDWTRIGEYAMPGPVSWYETCGLYLSAATVLAVLSAIRGKFSAARRTGERPALDD